MNKTDLRNIFEAPFNQADWLKVLRSVFGAKQLFSTPKSILLPSNHQASEAFELGSFSTSDDRIIGLYKIHLNENVWLQRNKVGLRELLRNVYKYDVDGAVVVFVQDEKWRLSFISEIKVLNDEGEVIEQATEPKRFTYLLGEDEKVRTPADRLSKLTGKSLALNDILDAFSVEALNEEFYKTVQGFFYQLIGGKIGKGKKAKDYGDGILDLPQDHQIAHEDKQEFGVRLIGRMVFCWFLKKKKSENETHLFPESLLSSKAVKENPNYYHTILERLFFQTLNTPMEERVDNLPEAAQQIPFLNGGLFEAQKLDCYRINKKTGLNLLAKEPFITNDWFFDFFTELEKYNFTIDENSVTEVEVSVDPEMLGRIFENLLAEIDPDSGETARKSTGSFYTPREIVDYMATESLVQYIHNKTNIENDKLRPIFKLLEQKDPEFSQKEREGILDALDQIKILDPACGSGAFPMGVLQKVTQALQKLDPEAKWWKARQIKRITNPTVKKMLKEKLASSSVEYARKIGVIQNSLYGVDIQPIAAEISKLRCFLSLMVDEKIDETKPNRGVEPLPNLEFKFVTADTLIKLPEDKDYGGLFNSNNQVEELEAIRNEYIQSYGKRKLQLKKRFLSLQQKIAHEQGSLFGDKSSKAYKLGNWNPFGHEKSDWFDPKWMFDVDKFDVVIGNPPYVDSEKMTVINKEYRKKLASEYNFASGNWDLFLVFIEKGIRLLKQSGAFTYIIPNKLIGAKYAKKARKELMNLSIKEIRDYSRIKVFKTADIYPITLLISNENISNENMTYFIKMENINYNISKNKIKLAENQQDIFWDKYFLNEISFKLLNHINTFTKLKTKKICKITGAATVSEAYSIKELMKDENKGDQNLKIINTGTIDPYVNLWGKKKMTYIKGKYEFPVITTEDLSHLNTKRLEQAQSYKIIIAGMSRTIEAFLDKEGEFLAGKSTTIVLSKSRYTLCFLIAILNSKLMKFFIPNQYSSLKMAGDYLNINPSIIKNIPVPHFDKDINKTFEKIVISLTFILKSESTISTISSTHISQLFKDVIDAMVMELYFKEDFEKADIEIIKYVERDFEPIEGIPEEEQIKIIHSTYQKLRAPDNELRNNMKLMDIKLADIVMPIKTGK